MPEATPRGLPRLETKLLKGGEILARQWILVRVRASADYDWALGKCAFVA